MDRVPQSSVLPHDRETKALLYTEHFQKLSYLYANMGGLLYSTETAEFKMSMKYLWIMVSLAV